jgi:hypothetical protein
MGVESERRSLTWRLVITGGTTPGEACKARLLGTCHPATFVRLYVFTALGYIAGALVVAVMATLFYWHFSWARRTRSELNAALSDMNTRLSQLESRLELQPVIPPMSIFLEPIDRKWHVADELCRQIDRWMMLHQFQRVGYFSIEELDGDELCVYLSNDQLLVAAVRMSRDSAEPFVEFCFDLGQGDRGGTSNPPASTIRPPLDSAGCHFEGKLTNNPQLLYQMYDRALQLVEEHKPLPVSRERIAEFFEEAHACEMALRVTSGGISESEIHEVLQRQGISPTTTQVAWIQRQWQSAIEDYLLEFSARGKSRQMDGQRILVVHDGSIPSYVATTLRPVIQATLKDAREVELLSSELEQMLQRFSPREAVARFRPLLPLKNRFDLVDQMNRPVSADVYALPITGYSA